MGDYPKVVLNNWEIWAFSKTMIHKNRRGINIESKEISDGVSINMDLTKEEIVKIRDYFSKLLENWEK